MSIKNRESSKEKKPADGTISEEFLLQEYDHLSRTFLWNEEHGEKRLGFYMTLTTAALAALIALTTANTPLLDPAVGPTVFAVGVIVLLSFGFVTLVRIIHRNNTTTEYKEAFDRLRQLFVSRNSEYLHYLPYFPYAESRKRNIRIPSMGTGGFVQTISVVNSLVAGIACIFLLQWYLSFLDSIFLLILQTSLGIITIVASWTFHMLYTRQRYAKEHKIHLELRWFFEEEASQEVISWFIDRRFGSYSEKTLEDTYYVTGSKITDRLGIKQRENKLEVKIRKTQESYSLANIHGKVEEWRKLEWVVKKEPGADIMTNFPVPINGSWLNAKCRPVKVKKTRKRHWFRYVKEPILVPESVATRMIADSAAELTEITIDGNKSWTLAFDVFAKQKNGHEILKSTVEWLMQGYPGTDLTRHNSCGYPHWLNGLDQNLGNM